MHNQLQVGNYGNSFEKHWCTPAENHSQTGNNAWVYARLVLLLSKAITIWLLITFDTFSSISAHAYHTTIDDIAQPLQFISDEKLDAGKCK